MVTLAAMVPVGSSIKVSRPPSTVRTVRTVAPSESAAAAAPGAASPSGPPVTTWATRKVPWATVRDPAPAAATASLRSRPARASLNACTHSGER